MKLPDITIKCPSGPNARRESRAMAHRRGLLKGKVTLGTLGILGVGLLLAGSIFISNQTTGLRKSIADMDDRREFLEAGSGELLTKYNAATSAKVIIARAKIEIGLVEQENPGLVLVCKDPGDQEGATGAWQRFLNRFGGGDAALAAGEQVSLVVGSMISLTPRNAQAAETTTGGQP